MTTNRGHTSGSRTVPGTTWEPSGERFRYPVPGGVPPVGEPPGAGTDAHRFPEGSRIDEEPGTVRPLPSGEGSNGGRKPATTPATLAYARSRTTRAHPLDAVEEVEPMTAPDTDRVKVRRLWSPRLPEGLDLYRIGRRHTGPRYLVAPVLADDAPEPVVEAFLDDLRAQALGECPACGGVPRLTREPPAPGEPGRAAWEVLPLYVSVRHDDRCPVVTLADEVARWRLPTTGPEGVPD